MSVLNREGEAEGRNQLNAEGRYYLHPAQNIIGALKYSSTRWAGQLAATVETTWK
jgi:hypothetical protein